MKHIYVYLAPAYFVYLLRNYCISGTNLSYKNALQSVSFRNLIVLSSLVFSIFFVTYIPFYDHIGQVSISKTELAFIYFLTVTGIIKNVSF